MILVMHCLGFIGEDGIPSDPRMKTVSNHTNSNPVHTSIAQHCSPAADSQHQKTLQDQLHSVLRKNPIRKTGVSGGKRKFGMLTNPFVCIVYVCNEFSVVSSKLTKNLILVVTVPLSMLIHDYMRIGYT